MLPWNFSSQNSLIVCFSFHFYSSTNSCRNWPKFFSLRFGKLFVLQHESRSYEEVFTQYIVYQVTWWLFTRFCSESVTYCYAWGHKRYWRSGFGTNSISVSPRRDAQASGSIPDFRKLWAGLCGIHSKEFRNPWTWSKRNPLVSSVTVTESWQDGRKRNGFLGVSKLESRLERDGPGKTFLVHRKLRAKGTVDVFDLLGWKCTLMIPFPDKSSPCPFPIKN